MNSEETKLAYPKPKKSEFEFSALFFIIINYFCLFIIKKTKAQVQIQQV